MNKKILTLRYSGVLLYALAAVAVRGGFKPVGTVLFLLLMAGECFLIFRETNRFLDLRILLSLSWLSGIALSTLQLSRLQATWATRTWTITGLFYFAVLGGYDLWEHFHKHSTAPRVRVDKDRLKRRLLEACIIVMFLGTISFLIECIKFDFVIPIFDSRPHSYTEFHITGLHYFVVSLMFVHMLSMICFFGLENLKKTETMLLIMLNIAALFVPVMLLSKFNLLIGIAMPSIIWMLLQRKLKKRYIAAIVLVAVLLICCLFYYMITKRNYPPRYLESVFHFKNADTPVLIQYPYIYIVNNFENLNLLVSNLKHHSFGIRILFPFFALTGLKFIPTVQSWLQVEQYLTCESLNTLTILYDVFGDFGILGVLGFGLILGGISSEITYNSTVRKNLFCILIFVQFAVYFSLAFFSTWFSNPTVWFWFIATFAISLWCTRPDGKFSFSFREMFGGSYDC